MVWKIVGNLECVRRGVFGTVNLSSKYVIITPLPKTKRTLAVSHTHAMWYHYH